MVFQIVDLGGSESTSRAVLLAWRKVHRTFFAKLGRDLQLLQLLLLQLTELSVASRHLYSLSTSC